MKRKISSTTQTNFYQTGFVLFTFPLFMIFIFSLSQSKENWFAIISYFLGFFTILVVAINMLFKLNLVEIDDEKKSLVVQTTSWFSSKRILVPYKNIKKISKIPLLQNPEIVTIELIIPSNFGHKIRFIPKFRFFSFGAHPIVDELNQRITEYKLSH